MLKHCFEINVDEKGSLAPDSEEAAADAEEGRDDLLPVDEHALVPRAQHPTRFERILRSADESGGGLLRTSCLCSSPLMRTATPW